MIQRDNHLKLTDDYHFFPPFHDLPRVFNAVSPVNVVLHI